MEPVSDARATGQTPAAIVDGLPDMILGAAALEHERGMNSRALFGWSIAGLIISGASLTVLGLFGERRSANHTSESTPVPLRSTGEVQAGRWRTLQEID
jgi:hypothetical protein